MPPNDERNPPPGNWVDMADAMAAVDTPVDPSWADELQASRDAYRGLIDPWERANPVRLWVDDLRPAPEGWQWATTSADAIEILDDKYVVELSLDHDLGGDDTTRPIVLWMCETRIWPGIIRVHSANPVGVEWLVGMIDRYGPGISR